MGAEVKRQVGKSDYIAGSLFWQRQFGDHTPSSSSWLNSSPGSPVVTGGGTVDKNSVGLSLTWGRKINSKADISLSYHGLYGSKGISTDFDIMYNYKF